MDKSFVIWEKAFGGFERESMKEEKTWDKL